MKIELGNLEAQLLNWAEKELESTSAETKVELPWESGVDSYEFEENPNKVRS